MLSAGPHRTLSPWREGFGLQTEPRLSRRMLLFAAAGLGLSACGDGAALDRLAQGPRAKVAAVPAGDRLTLEHGREVLLAGVQAPAPGRAFGNEARAALEHIAGGRSVELLFAGQPSEQGAQTAQVRLSPGRLWVEGALLDAGAVWVRTAADDRALASQMLAREARARSARRGLWALRDYGVRLPDEIERGEHGFRLVEGRVAKSGRYGGLVYLDFGRDWRSVVSAHIPSSALRDFRSAGLDPLRLEGQLIRVRGVVNWSRGGPVLTLDHPEALEVLSDRRP